MAENPPSSHSAVEGLNAVSLAAMQALSSSHTIQGTSFEATYIAYRQLRLVAEEIAQRVAKTSTAGAVVLIAEDGIESDLIEFRELEARIARADLLIEELQAEVDAKKLRPLETRAVAPGVVGAIVSSGLAVASLFSRKISEQHFEIKVDDATLILLVKPELRKKELILLTADELMHKGLGELHGGIPEGPFADCLQKLHGFGQDLRTSLAQVLLPLPEPERAEGGQQQVGPTPNATAEDLTRLKLRLESAIKDVEAIEAGLWARARNLARGAVAGELLNDGSRVLKLRVLAGGGASVTRNGLFTDPVKHAGGVLVSYALHEADGTFVEADVLVGYERIEAGSLRKRFLGRLPGSELKGTASK